MLSPCSKAHKGDILFKSAFFLIHGKKVEARSAARGGLLPLCPRLPVSSKTSEWTKSTPSFFKGAGDRPLFKKR